MKEKDVIGVLVQKVCCNEMKWRNAIKTAKDVDS